MRRGRTPFLVTGIVVAGLVSGCAGTRKERAPVPTPEPQPAPPPVSTTEPAPPEPPEAWRSARTLRIGLAVAAPSVLVAGSTDWTLAVQGGPEIAEEDEGDPLRVSRIGAGTIEVFRQGDSEPLWTGTPADTLILTPSRGAFSGWGGNWYRGTFRIYASRPDGITLVNEVDLEGYLRSVLPNEIGTPPESDFEAVKAQAVAARSYTLSYLGRRAPLGFDLYASVEDQVYGGVTRENWQSDRALDLTRGELLLNEGAPIRALYSSTCGGRTANVEDVWPWPWTSYLRSVRDAGDLGGHPYCTISRNFRWREEWDVGDFMSTVREYGPVEGGALAALRGDLLDVRVRSRGRSGRVQELAVSTTRGEWVVRGDRTRWVLRRPVANAPILRSSFIKIGVVRDRRGRPVRVVATGGGNGHGIGMCQWGAMGMARAGKSYREILRHYYKSSVLTKIG